MGIFAAIWDFFFGGGPAPAPAKAGPPVGIIALSVIILLILGGYVFAAPFMPQVPILKIGAVIVVVLCATVAAFAAAHFTGEMISHSKGVMATNGFAVFFVVLTAGIWAVANFL